MLNVSLSTGEVLTLWVPNDSLGPEDEGGGGVREPRRPIGPDGALGAQEPLS